MVSGVARLPSPSPLLSLAQSAGETYVGTPSFSNCSRVATPPLPSVDSKDADAQSGSLSSTFSKEGALSASRGTVAFASRSPGRTGSVQVAVADSRSASPSESRISVDPWLSDTACRGGAVTRTFCPQLLSVRGYPGASSEGREDAAGPPPHPASSRAPVSNRVARRELRAVGTGGVSSCGRWDRTWRGGGREGTGGGA